MNLKQIHLYVILRPKSFIGVIPKTARTLQRGEGSGEERLRMGDDEKRLASNRI